VLELHVLARTGSQLHGQIVAVDDFGPALEVLHLAMLHQLAGAAGQPLDNVVLEVAQFSQIELRLVEFNAPRFGMPRFVDHFRDVQQRLGRDAAAIHAHPARVDFRIDQRSGESEIGCQKCGGVAPGAAADNDDLNINH
jgi:hypothetical protein